MKPNKLVPFVLLLAASSASLAASIDPADRYAWGENLGWINHRDGFGAVQVYADHLEGFAWAENLGWVKLGSHSGGGAHSYANGAADDWGVNRAPNGTLSGYAWSETAGWLNFGAAGGGVTLDPASGAFSGYAWGENVGWVKFAGSAPDYRVALAKRSVLAASGGNGAVGGGGDYPPFAPVALTATPDGGYAFVGWAPAPCAPQFTMPDADLSCTGSFGGDADGDGMPVGLDNCPTIGNPDQADTNGDGRGDVCPVYYVKALVATPGDGLSWGAAFGTLQDALEAGITGGGAIWVAAGVHYPDEWAGTDSDDPAHSFDLPSGVELLGGFVGSEALAAQRDPWRNRTVLSGDIGQDDADPDGNQLAESTTHIQGVNSLHVVTTQDLSAPPRIDGFFVTAGDAAGSGDEGTGGGWFNRNASPAINRVQFLGNRAAGVGGGLYALGGDPTLDNSALTGNQAPAGAALSQSGGTLSMSGLTLAQNVAQSGGGAVQGDVASLTLDNSILWGNTGGSLSLVSGATALVTHSIVAGAGNSGAGWVGPGSDAGGNRDADPKLLDPARGDVRIAAADSAALNAGDNSLAIGTADLAGQVRIQGTAVEIGAMEQNPVVPASAPALSGTATSDILTTVTANTSVNAGAGDDVVISARGRQVITLGAGRDTVVWQYFPDSDVVNDFALGEDGLDVRRVLQAIGYAGSTPLASGHVKCLNGGGGVLVQLDRDGAAGAVYAPVNYALVKGAGVTAASLCQTQNLID